MYLEYSNNPNAGGNDDTDKTPKDKVIVFTYKVVANKVNEKQEALPGAAFELFKYVKVSEGWGWKSLGVKGARDNGDGTYTVDSEPTTQFSWNGLDDGKYKIVEVVTPSGYNSIKPIEFDVTAEHQEDSDNPQLINLSGNKFTGDISTGALTSNIENKSGSTLPSTGGIGTTIFYVVGVILMLGAGVLLVTKKRMSSNR